MTKAAAWFAAVVVAIALAFVSAMALLREPSAAPSQVRAELAEARQIETYASDLRAAIDRLNASPLPAPMLDDLRSKLRQTQQSILRARMTGPAYNTLLAAADRVSAYASSPRNEALRAAATRAQTDLESCVERELKRLAQELARSR